MQYQLKTGDPSRLRTACLVLGVFSGRKLPAATAAFDAACNSVISRLLKLGDFNGDIGESQLLYETGGADCERILLIGLGEQKKLDLTAYGNAVACATRVLEKSHAIEAVCSFPMLEVGRRTLAGLLRETVICCEATRYRFSQCKSDQKPAKRPLKKLGLFIGEARRSRNLELALSQGQAIAKGVALARNLGDLPGNICTPAYLADRARSLGQKSDKLKVQILEEKRMQALGMGALLSVSRGSRQPAKLIVMEYQGADPKKKPVVLIGKGLTFDAGGISLKPAIAMDEMKYDMCGGASVLGTMQACIELQLPINLVGLVPASENLPDGDANKPGDIVTSMSGQTIEILNTDAEGRLILCDTLTFAARYKPMAVVDIATLTGACVVALGDQASGLLGNDDTLAEQLLAAGEASGDRAWRLPLWDGYQSQLDSNFADMANIGGKGAGTITAACFLSRFANKFKWAHLDIAGTAWKSGSEKGSTGRPVPLLTQFLLQRCKLAD